MAAYCRVSSEHEEQLNSFENQVDYYTKYISSKPEYELVDIYADEGISGTNTKKRAGFNRMIDDARAGKIDYIITKSISRFARNTADSLTNLRILRNLGINVFFEKENINSLEATGELLITILSSLAQEESRNISENCKWGIRSNFQKGKVHLNATYFLGFDKTPEGKFVINEEEAKIVRRIFDSFLEGMSYTQIGKMLREEGIQTARGTTSWAANNIKAMLMNEKYKGDACMQKTYTSDFLTKRLKKNNGELPQYYLEDFCEAIIPKERWEATQLEVERREAYIDELHVRNYGYCKSDNPFIAKVVCGKCGEMLRKLTWESRDTCYWKCRNEHCKQEHVQNATLYKAFRIAWNSICAHPEEYEEYWDELLCGNELEKLRATQMKQVIANGPITTDVPELIRLTLERIVAFSAQDFEVRFLDGTIKKVHITE